MRQENKKQTIRSEMAMKRKKLPGVREYKDALLINNYEVPYVVLNNDGSSTTKIVDNGEFVEVRDRKSVV